MMDQAQIKLTVLYSFIFLIFFWSLSFGVYAWMNTFFGDQAVSRFEIRPKSLFFETSDSSKEPFSDVVMDELRTVLLMADTTLLFFIPVISWILTGKTLQPVKTAHNKEQQFFADASHDLKTPLTILKGEIELGLKKRQTVNQYINLLKSSKEEIDRLVDLTESLMFFSKDQSEGQNILFSEVDLTDLVIERIGSFKPLAKTKKIKLSFHPALISVVVFGNASLLRRMLTNLLDNAFKYTSPNGQITVKLSADSNLSKIMILDTGIGISKQDQERIFDRFFVADSSRSKSGHGLGLSIVKKIVDIHHGKITVESETGRGSAFTITIPKFMPNTEKNLS